MGRCLEMPSSGPSGEVGEGSSHVITSPGPGPGPGLCGVQERDQNSETRLPSDLWLLGVAVIGARSIAQEISRGADGCKGLVNYSKILTREAQLKLQRRVAAAVVATVAAMLTVCRCFPKPKKRAQRHSGP